MYSANTRYQKRKKQRMNLLLNIAIGMVALLIIYFAAQLIFGSNSEETALVADEEELEGVEQEEDALEEDTPEETIEVPTAEEANVVDEPIDEPIIEEREAEEAIEDRRDTVVDQQVSGQWQPIGTVQSEPFEASFNRNSVNWAEMTAALQYATGLGDDMIIWRLGNGGNLQSAVGIVSTHATKNTPYQVRLEWVPEKGWKPVSVEQLTENPTPH